MGPRRRVVGRARRIGPRLDPASHLLRVSVPGRPNFVLRRGQTGSGIPAWNDTSHQQLGSAALRSAHRNGLRVIVSSAVTSEWLCAILSAAAS